MREGFIFLFIFLCSLINYHYVKRQKPAGTVPEEEKKKEEKNKNGTKTEVI